MVVEADLRHWQPKALLAVARTQSLPEFMMRCECAFMLVVMIEPGDRELARGLTRDFGEHDELQSVSTERHARERSANQPRAKQRPFEEDTCERIPLALTRKGCHVVPLCRRSVGSAVDRVSLGRSRDSDIVLRNPTVSKRHALFELNEDVRLLLRDCESGNGTFVNGKRVVAALEVLPGDTIKLGTVEARLCTTEGFWRLVNG